MCTKWAWGRVGLGWGLAKMGDVAMAWMVPLFCGANVILLLVGDKDMGWGLVTPPDIMLITLVCWDIGLSCDFGASSMTVTP